MTALLKKIEVLSVTEKLDLIHLIWKSLPKESLSPPISEETKIILNKRLLKLQANPNSGISVDESKNKLKKKLEVHRKNRRRRTT